MAVKKPIEKAKQFDIDDLIAKGAPVLQDIKKEEEKKWMYISLRIPVKMVQNIDGILEERVGISRTGWILEAIQEKMKID